MYVKVPLGEPAIRAQAVRIASSLFSPGIGVKKGIVSGGSG